MNGTRIAELPLVGGHRALDLVNTVTPRLPADGREDHLATPEDLLAWSQRAGLATAAETRTIAEAWHASPAAASRALAAVKDIREATFAVLAACLGSESDAARAHGELDHLTLAWAAAASRSRLTLTADGVAARLAACSPPELLLTDRAAQDAVDLLCGTGLQRLGMCPPEAGGCGWLFLDHSRNQSRRWCTMAACGSGAKARRLTERRRTTRAADHH